VLEYSSRRDRLRRWIATRKCWDAYAKQYPNRHGVILVLGFVDFLKIRWSARNLGELILIMLKNLLNARRGSEDSRRH
jgi:hypothetical protein